MRKFTLLLLALFTGLMGFTAPVSLEKARTVAANYYSHYTGKSATLATNPEIKIMNENVLYYIFNFAEGGFVVVSGDDVATPILAESDQGTFELIPPVQFWLDAMTEEINHLISTQTDNSTYASEWANLENNTYDRAPSDIGPLCTTTWDQGQWYNYYCPVAAGGPGGKAWAGCVATSMGQIMKYHNFPQHGVLAHSYVHPTYGQQQADFGNTTYNWSNMPNSATSGNYQSIATLLYHDGVSVNMDYGPDGSGAYSQDVPWALTTYFNYDPSTIKLSYRDDYSSAEWVSMLKTDLDLNHPIYYAGATSTMGHAWVCDGYRTSDDKFHMNWGWSGASNGYFAVTANISAGGYTFSQNFNAITGIQPYNPNLVARITNVTQNQLIAYNSVYNVNCSVEDGTATLLSLYLDNELLHSAAAQSFNYALHTSDYPPGNYTLKVVATDGTNTVYHAVDMSMAEWIPQASAFATQSRGITNLHAVDSLTAWAAAYDGSNTSNYIAEFTMTSDGGETWHSGKVIATAGYGLGNISGVNANVAYCALYKGSGTQNATCGVYKTIDGGTTWTKSGTVLSGSASFADNVWFWNENEGMCHGDVRDNYFEIYTTSDGGTTWTRVPKADIGTGGNAVSGEGGWTGVISTVGDSTVMFGTNKSNLYISHDRGHHWTISATGINPDGNGVSDIAFRDKMKGIVVQTNGTPQMRETLDGGLTWQSITPTGPYLTNDLAFVPGTENTFVCTGAAEGAYGASYSEDGGKTWTLFAGTDANQFLALDMVNNHCGWAGGFNLSETEGGMFKFVGYLDPGVVLDPVTNVFVTAVQRDVYVEWLAAGSGETGYNVYRNDELLTASPVTELSYVDASVPNGHYNYCVTAVYPDGESAKACDDVWITLGVQYPDQIISVYPNPATTELHITANSGFDKVRILNVVGQEVYSYNNSGTNLRIATENFRPGMYVVQIINDNKTITRKISVK